MANYLNIGGPIRNIHSGESTDSSMLTSESRTIMLMSNGTIWNSITDGFCKRCDQLTKAEKEHLQNVYLQQYKTLVQFENDFGSHAYRMAKRGMYKHFRMWVGGKLVLYRVSDL